MEKLDKIVEISSESEMKLEVDPRSNVTPADNLIAKPEEVEVRGTKRMLQEKSKKARWI